MITGPSLRSAVIATGTLFLLACAQANPAAAQLFWDWGVGTAVSKGCIRMYNKDVLDLYPRASTGAKVTVTWQSFNSAESFAASPQPTRPRLREIRQSDLPERF